MGVIVSGPLWQPPCYAQIAGLTAATFLTRLLVPVVFTIVIRDLGWIRWDRLEQKAAAETPAASLQEIASRGSGRVPSGA